ncbi:MAG: MFS transporter [Candidatus Atribacteria bacterium]|nr:MAG: MFS transporter [Candidatus Atribacteria bacterium]
MKVRHIVNEQRRWILPFFTIWTGQQFSIVGTMAAQFALVWWLTATTGSATVLATAALVALIPQIVLGPFVGALVDRWNRRVVMIAADSFVAMVSLWLVYLFWTDSLAIWHVYVAMLARSVGSTFHWPAMAASTTLMVPERHYTRIGGLNETIEGLLGIMAPPLGALLMAILPLHQVMMVDVVTAAFAVAPLLFVRIPQPAAEDMKQMKAESFLASTKEGLRYVMQWPGFMALLGVALVVKITLTPAFSLFPLLIKDHFEGGPIMLSQFEAILGGGILLGGLLLSTWGGFRRKIHTVLVGIIGVGVTCAVLGITPASTLWMGMAAVLVLGFKLSLANSPVSAILQSSVPPEMQGRVFGLLGSLFALTTPIGLAIAGPVSDMLGVRFWFVAAGVACILAGVASLFIPALIQIEEQQRRASGPAEKLPEYDM